MKRFLLSKKGIILAAVTIFTLGNVIGVSASSSLKEITAYLDEGVRLIVNGTPFTSKDSEGNKLDPINYNGSIYIPLRSVAEAVGMKVKWDDTSRTASLGTFQENQEGDEVYTSKDKNFQVSLSKNWVRNDSYLQQINPVIKFGAVNSSSATIYLGVTSEPKTAFSNDFNLDMYSGIVMRGIKAKIDNISIESTKDLNINGFSAKQFIIYGTLKDINLGYHITLVETKNRYYELLGWAGADDLKKNQDEFVKIASTFKELNN